MKMKKTNILWLLILISTAESASAEILLLAYLIFIFILFLDFNYLLPLCFYSFNRAFIFININPLTCKRIIEYIIKTELILILEILIGSILSIIYNILPEFLFICWNSSFLLIIPLSDFDLAIDTIFHQTVQGIPFFIEYSNTSV